MLLALASMQRVQTLKMLQVSSIKIFSDSVVIPVDALLKHSRANRNSFSVVLPAFPYDPVLCPCITLKHYIARTKILRGSTDQLFISFHRSFHPVTCSTLSRWIKRVMYECRFFDTDFFYCS